MTTAFLALMFVCVLLQFHSQGYPVFFFLPVEIIVNGGGEGERGAGTRRRSWAGLPWLGKLLFPLYNLVHAEEPEEPQPEAAVSHSVGFHSCTGPELCVIQKLSKTMAIPLHKISFSVSVLLAITAVCRNTAAGNPGEKKNKNADPVRVQVLAEAVPGEPTFKKLSAPLSDSSGVSESQDHMLTQTKYLNIAHYPI